MEKLENVLEALLYLAGTPLSINDISDKLEVTDEAVMKAGEKLKKRYQGDCGLQLRIFNKKMQFVSNPVYADLVAKVLNPVRERELSTSMLETIAIIAYKQPITRLEIEEIRGVNSDYALQVLSKNNLIEVVGRKDAIGKPVLFGTTDNFLKRFKLSAIDELPDMQSLLDRIMVVNQASSELYHRDEYEQNQIEFDDLEEELNVTAEQRDSEAQAEDALGEITDEQVPDFLQDEENVRIIT